MKTMLNRLVLVLAGGVSLANFTAEAELEVSASVNIHADADFYAPLAANGTWIDVGSYGRCWRPAGVAVGWRPYCILFWPVGLDRLRLVLGKR